MSDDMRATRHCGKKGYAKHNDRDFDIEQADHIDIDRTQNNFYWHCYNKSHPEMTFTDAEMRFYEHCYSTSLDAKNSRYTKQGHSERTKTIEDIYKSPRTRPTETIYQVGNKDQTIDADLLKNIFNSYLRKISAWNKEHGSHYHILSIALHVDETTPHVHERGIWDIETQDGRKIAQDRALEEAGVPLPDPDKPKGRYNNRKMVIDALFRDFWIQACKEQGLEIDETPIPTQKHREKEDFIDLKIRDKVAELEDVQKRLKRLSERMEDLQVERNALEDEKCVLERAIEEMTKPHDLNKLLQKAETTRKADMYDRIKAQHPDIVEDVEKQKTKEISSIFR